MVPPVQVLDLERVGEGWAVPCALTTPEQGEHPLQPGSRSGHRGAGCGGKTGNRDNLGKEKTDCQRERRREESGKPLG